ncbi:porin [Bradyrhizobium sp. 190]|uniref:porin n=1 Tax=Bradyrhizobium sp. 190 TaxID=2782658 RepID=UPI001FFA1739|nr:porin [Bradyrhizobium sp. 190]MCK1511225.1 porin [Bradyrhizobium sp. 190]
MTMIKSLILGSAAGLVALSGAQAADLPVKAKAVEYVRICSLYGAGFFYIPGTDTCIKLGGYVRVDTTFNGGVYGGPFYSGDGGQGNRYRDYFLSRSRMAITVDTRTATEYGVVRTFGQGDFQFQNFGTTNPGTAATTGQPLNNALLSTAGGGYVAVEMVFIQFAGFTFGKSASAYATPWNGYPGNNNSYLMGGPDYVTGVNNIQYTAQFGNGVSATIGLDDPTVFNRTAVWNLANGVNVNGGGTNAYSGLHSPDIAGNIRVDQAWGLFQISGLAHLVSATYNTLGAAGAPTNGSELSGHPDDKWGGAVTAALQIKNLPTGAGDDFKIDVTYAKGSTKSVISTSGGTPNFSMFGGSGNGAYQSVAFGNSADGVFMPGIGGTGGIILTSAWGVRGAFNHNWDPYWSTSLWGSYASVRYDGGTNDNINGLGTTTAKGAYCAGFAATHGGQAAVGNNVGNYTCNPDFNIAQVGVVTRWTPVKNLTFSAEVGAFFLDQKMTGSSTFTATAPKPNAVYEFKDQSTVFLNVRAQRNF